MDIKDLNKSQLLLLILLVTFIASVVTGITVVSLMDQAPKAVSVPINRIVKQTIERIVPDDSIEGLSAEEKKMLQDLKNIESLSASVYLQGDNKKFISSGLLLGENQVLVTGPMSLPKEKEKYIVQSIFGEQDVLKITQGKDYVLITIGRESRPVLENKEELENASTQ